MTRQASHADKHSFYSKPPLKLFVGKKRKAFYIFEDQIKGKSKKIEESLELQNNGEKGKEVYLPFEDDGEVDVFVKWLYSGEINLSFLEKDGTDLCSTWIDYYGLAHRLIATEFSNQLIDELHERLVQNRGSLAKDETFQVNFSHLTKLGSLGLHSKHAYGFLVFVTASNVKQFQNSTPEYQNLFRRQNTFHYHGARVYYDVINAMMGLGTGKITIPTKFQKNYYLHEHSNKNESCYNESCEEYRKERTK